MDDHHSISFERFSTDYTSTYIDGVVINCENGTYRDEEYKKGFFSVIKHVFTIKRFIEVFIEVEHFFQLYSCPCISQD